MDGLRVEANPGNNPDENPSACDKLLSGWLKGVPDYIDGAKFTCYANPLSGCAWSSCGRGTRFSSSAHCPSNQGSPTPLALVLIHFFPHAAAKTRGAA